MTQKTKINFLDQDIEFELDYYIENDSMDYEWWGHKESIKSENYPVIEFIKWDESKFTIEENKQISDYVWDEKQIEQFEKLIIKQHKQ